MRVIASKLLLLLVHGGWVLSHRASCGAHRASLGQVSPYVHMLPRPRWPTSGRTQNELLMTFRALLVPIPDVASTGTKKVAWAFETEEHCTTGCE